MERTRGDARVPAGARVPRERPYVEAVVPDDLGACLDGYDETVSGDTLAALVDDLRDAAPDERAFDVETGPVAVCEFAAENGLAVELRD
ncbi:hypothetical protein [Halarchaeum acidiphilum]|uniref:hypothetical protein n=1 Tax=Halarchaeum acidiphilum TaxID=489138 RepID=UPI000382D303|nr:hypothetical protein [Halarchaeum acidiphilum]